MRVVFSEQEATVPIDVTALSVAIFIPKEEVEWARVMLQIVSSAMTDPNITKYFGEVLAKMESGNPTERVN